MNSFIELMARNWKLTVVVIILLADAIILLVGLLAENRLFILSTSEKKHPTRLTIAHVVGWTLGPPAWFFIETYTLDSELLPSVRHATDPALKAAYDSLRLAQDLAKNFWAAVLAAILFSVPKK